jgi:hypothetical protein
VVFAVDKNVMVAHLEETARIQREARHLALAAEGGAGKCYIAGNR